MVLGTIGWILGVAAAVWVIYDVLTTQQGMQTAEKIIWIVAALVFSIITAIVYYFVKKQ